MLPLTRTNKPVSIFFVITNLDCGGAEVMLLRLLSHLDRRRFTAQVVSLVELGEIGRRIQALGIPVRALGMRRGRPSLNALFQLVRWLRQDQPHLVQTWMYHADLIGSIAAKVAGGFPVIWCIHQGDLNPENTSRLTLQTARLCA
ncbi:MAG: glycosyltransferase, partial [Nitrosomonas sp.]|nr:glycosyltransferase [Nitrosomonas sp.]